jgi:hypothetical protein
MQCRAAQVADMQCVLVCALCSRTVGSLSLSLSFSLNLLLSLSHLFLFLGPVPVRDDSTEVSVLLLRLGCVKGFSLLGVLWAEQGRKRRSQLQCIPITYFSECYTTPHENNLNIILEHSETTQHTDGRQTPC